MSAVARPHLRRLPTAAALSAVGSAGFALAQGPGTPAWASLAIVGVPVSLVGAALVQRGRELHRRGATHALVIGVLAIGVGAASWSLLAQAGLLRLGLALVVGVAGAATIALSITRIADELDGGRTPWQALAGGPTAAAASRAQFERVAPLLAGVIAVLVALRILAFEVSGSVGGSPRGALLLMLVLLAVLIVGPGWALRGLINRRRRARRAGLQRASDDRIAAAHLHDSVLQTLALIQRSADDPARMAQLARQEERGLREWLAGRTNRGQCSLAGALRSAAAEVEDEFPGTVIDVLTVGDAPLDPPADAMCQAAREAMRNAARHARTRIEVLLDVDRGDTRLAFVRDVGAGFDLASVPNERRGVRDAIIGRMEQAGGAAMIESGPEGTEVTLRFDGAPR